MGKRGRGLLASLLGGDEDDEGRKRMLGEERGRVERLRAVKSEQDELRNLRSERPRLEWDTNPRLRTLRAVGAWIDRNVQPMPLTEEDAKNRRREGYGVH